MRISEKEIEIIKSNILKHINDAKIYLFGSRTNNLKRGGDIDIFVRVQSEPKR